MTTLAISEEMDDLLQRFEQALACSFTDGLLINTPKTLKAAMQYSTLTGGKRLRPLLAFAAGKIANADENIVMQVAIALEYIHVYSLIHDDLPAMDDDDLRRGKPTCHVAFNEATAILAGDALLTQSFAILAHLNLNPEIKIQLIQMIALAAGSGGMVGGQMLDIEAENQQISLSELQSIHSLKTGALIKASILAGALCGKLNHSEQAKLAACADTLGLAFQVQDDLLDVLSTSEILGKTVGKDQAQHKSTYPSLLGLEQSQQVLQDLLNQSLNALNEFDTNADALRNIVYFVGNRTH